MYNRTQDSLSPIILGSLSTSFAVSGSFFFLALAVVGYYFDLSLASNQKEIHMTQNAFALFVTNIVRASLLAFAGFFVSVAASVGSS